LSETEKGTVEQVLMGSKEGRRRKFGQPPVQYVKIRQHEGKGKREDRGQLLDVSKKSEQSTWSHPKSWE
jgi:hypothetical protein